VVELALLKGWQVMHIGDSRKQITRSGIGMLIGDALAKGWPDLVLCRPPRLMIRELKSDKGRLTPEQRGWLQALAACSIDVEVWQPRDWPQIESALA
jgi:hypothetical protein